MKLRLRVAIGRRAALEIAAGPAILVLVLLLAACAAPSADARDHGFYGSATGGWTKLSPP